MPHLNTEPGQHDFTVSAYIVRTDTPEPVLLLHQHKLLKQWLQFGGHIERHEDPWAAVTHEIAEESGYAITQLKVLQPPDRIISLTDVHLHPTPLCLLTHKFGALDHYHTDISFAFVTTQPPQDTVGKGESSQICTFTSLQLRAIKEGKVPESVRETGLFVLENCVSSWISIPADER